MQFISNIAKYIVNRIVYPHTYNNEVFCAYLRSKGAVIGRNTRFVAPKKTLVDDARLDYITIGNNCCFSHITMMAHDYSWYVLKDAFNELLPDAGGGITVGNNVFIGYQSVILKGTTIGDNVVIGARSVVKGTVPSNTVWAGVPARQICTLEAFYQKRKSREISDALFRRNHIRQAKGREATIEDMGWFAFLFLERTEELYSKYLSKLEFNGIQNDSTIRALFFGTAPKFSSFEEFLNL